MTKPRGGGHAIALPPEIGQLRHLTKLDFDNNPLTSPPPEILQQGIKAVLAYLREQLQAKQTQWVSKLLIVGEGGVGKTSLLRALRGELFNSEESTTHGIAIRTLELGYFCRAPEAKKPPSRPPERADYRRGDETMLQLL